MSIFVVFRLVLTRLSDLLGMAELRYDQFSRDAANRLRRGQLRGTIEQMRIMVICNWFFAPVLSFQAWNSGVNLQIIVWTIGIVAFSGWLLFSWSRIYHTDGRETHMRGFVRETVMNASLWVVGMAICYPVVAGDQKTIVTTIIAGALALGTVGFSRAPTAAFVYVAILSTGSAAVALLDGFRTGSSTDYIIALLSVTAGASVFNASLERGKASIKAFKDNEKLIERGELIDLLLKDYEEQTTEWLWETNAAGGIVSAPAQVLEMIGLDAKDVADVSLIHAIAAKSTAASREDLGRLRAKVEGHEDFHDIELSIVCARSNALRWIVMKGRAQFRGAKFRGYRGIFADATVAVEAKRQVEFLANHDGLTRMYNRTAVQERLEALLDKNVYAAGFLIDLDGFKQVNDRFGHLIGDSLLRIVAQRLLELESPDIFVARLGGDEFFALMTSHEPPRAETLAQFAHYVVRRLSKPYEVENFSLHLSASVGISCLNATGQKGSILLREADLALYEAKNNGRNRYEFFKAEMQQALNQRIAITERLKIAIRTNAIVSHYQPQYDLRDGRLVGFEALARWHDEELGQIRPDVFIPIAEQTGLIVELGETLLRQCCEEAVRWADRLGGHAPPLLSVNLSPIQFSRIDVAEMVSRALTDSRLPSHRLELEITEGVLIADKEVTAAKLREIVALGVSIALDDFGTGYSSLSYLKDLPLNRLKVDRSFVSNLDESSTRQIVETIIQLGQNLGLSVIAEGIETREEIALLASMGCEDGQGYYFGRPMPADEAMALILRTVPSGTARSA